MSYKDENERITEAYSDINVLVDKQMQDLKGLELDNAKLLSKYNSKAANKKRLLGEYNRVK